MMVLMMETPTTNWDLVRIQYELFGTSVPQIAHDNDIPPQLVDLKIQECEWKRNKLAQESFDLATVDSLENITEELLEHIKERINVVSLLKQESLNPLYIKLEVKLLHKAIEIAEQMSATGDKAANQLRALTVALQNLLAQNRVLGIGQKTIEESDNKLVVQIMNQVMVAKDEGE